MRAVAKVRQLPARQRIRKALVLVSFLLMPVTLYYFSPALILGGAAEGVVTAGFIVFLLMLLSALFVGRLWCGWACPAGGLQEFSAPINDRPVPGGRFNWIKWGIWFPWIAGIAALALSAGGYHRVDLLYGLEGGVTMAIPPDPQAPPWYLIYYIVVIAFLGAAALVGRRAGCHYLCWMAPFMIIGRKISNALHGPALRLRAQPDRCISCGACTRNCPMSLEVQQMVQANDMENSECILCATCIDVCPTGTIGGTVARASG